MPVFGMDGTGAIFDGRNLWIARSSRPLLLASSLFNRIARL